MHAILPLLTAAAVAIAVTACASPPEEEEPPTARMAYASEGDTADPARKKLRRVLSKPTGSLAGRTIRIDDASDLVLRPGEVVLTFDDGPLPRRTQAILDILDEHGVKATFMMVGQMAQYYPDLARDVAARGHTVGTHSYSHRNLGSLSFDSAVEDIEKGRQSIAAALAPGGGKVSPFFRFPYLIETAALRQHVVRNGGVVVHPSIDSKDYWSSSPAQVRSRTLRLLERAGSGIVLFHDLHARTVAMLPEFLAELHQRGYKVVHLVPGSPEAEELLISALTARPRS